MLAIRLPVEIEERLDSLAKRTGRTKTFYAREAIVQHLEDLEDAFLADAVLERIQQGKERVFPLNEVNQRFGFRPKKVARRGRRKGQPSTRRSR